MTNSPNTESGAQKPGNAQPVAAQPVASVREVCEAFWKIEAAEDLYNWNVLGVRLWPLVRFRVFYNLTKNSGVYTWKTTAALILPENYPEFKGKKGHKVLWQGLTGWRWYLRKLIPDAWRDPRLVTWLKAEDVISPFSNRNFNGIDKYSQPVIDALGDKAIRFGVGSYDRKREWPHLDNLQGHFRKRWANIASIYVRLSLKKADYQKYARVIKFLETETRSSAGPYKNFPRWNLRNFLSERHGYRIMFRRLNIKRLFIVNASRMNFMAAAQDSGIKVIELQCGVFSNYNMQFSWPGRPQIPYLPNEIWTWGEYWTTGIENAGGQQIVVAGSTKEFEDVRQAGTNHKHNTIVVMSQPLIGAELYAASLELAKLRPEYTVVFKMHPKDLIEEFIGDKPANFSIAPEESASLKLLAESEICVGVFSTTLIEAAGLGNKVAMLKLAGWEHLSPLVNGGYARAYDTIQELSADLPNLPDPGDPYFFYGRRREISELLATR
jgi:hypothetical protein